MKSLITRLALGIGVSILMSGIFLGATVHADVNDFTINSFDTEYNLTKNDAQGQLAITEQIDLTFTDHNHGILRALPNSYKKHRLQLHIDDVSSPAAPSQWTTYQSNGNTVIKIGDPNATVTGHQHYSIKYTVRNVIGFYPDHDELFWDINGDQWGQPATVVSSVLHIPSDLQPSLPIPTCYTGSFGSTRHDCTVAYSKADSAVMVKTTKPLQPYQTLSVVVGFNKGYFHPSTWYETLGEYSGIIIGFLVPLVLIGGTGGIYWYKRGRDDKGRGVIVPQYDAPDDMSPLEVGTVIDFKTDNRDISATVIDLAVRGYIKIIETVKKRKILKDSKSYSLELLKTDFSGLKDFETKLLKGIFSDQTAHKVVELSDLKYKLSSTATELRSQMNKSLKDRGYLRRIPMGSGLRFVLTLVLMYVISFVVVAINQGPAVVGIGAGTVLLVIFLALLPSRTVKGTVAKEHAMGLKMYMDVAEKDRLNKLQSPDAPYVAQSYEPKHTVELFEKLLPYAIVLGVEKQWATKFENIYNSPPDWYGGNVHGFNAVYLASSINSGVGSAVNAAFSSPSSSSGSGGGAGGGGGGGGGGGW